MTKQTLTLHCYKRCSSIFLLVVLRAVNRPVARFGIWAFCCHLKTRKPCCRKETARCRKCSFLLKFANNIHYKY